MRAFVFEELDLRSVRETVTRLEHFRGGAIRVRAEGWAAESMRVRHRVVEWVEDQPQDSRAASAARGGAMAHAAGAARNGVLGLQPAAVKEGVEARAVDVTPVRDDRSRGWGTLPEPPKKGAMNG